MKRVKLSLNYKGLDHSAKVVFGNLVHNSLQGNTQLPSCASLLPKLSSAVTDLDNAIKATNPNAIAIKAKEVQLEKVLYALKAQVELECNDDDEVATSSGFSLSAPRIIKSKVFGATQGTLSGTVNLVCPYYRGAAYVWEIITDPLNSNVWQLLKITNTTGFTTAGLVAGTKYWFRCKAIVKDVEQTYTDPAMVHVV